MTCNKFKYKISLNKLESTSKVKEQISDELIQENIYHTNITKQRHLKKWTVTTDKIPEHILEIKPRI